MAGQQMADDWKRGSRTITTATEGAWQQLGRVVVNPGLLRITHGLDPNSEVLLSQSGRSEGSFDVL